MFISIVISCECEGKKHKTHPKLVFHQKSHGDIVRKPELVAGLQKYIKPKEDLLLLRKILQPSLLEKFRSSKLPTLESKVSSRT